MALEKNIFNVFEITQCFLSSSEFYFFNVQLQMFWLKSRSIYDLINFLSQMHILHNLFILTHCFSEVIGLFVERS